MSIFIIFLWSVGVLFIAFCLYQIAEMIYHNVKKWEEKLTKFQAREEELEKKRKDFLEECDKKNDLIWQEKNKAIEQYKAAGNAIGLAEQMKLNTQNEMEKLRTKVKELEKQLHHSRQRCTRISEKSSARKKQQNGV